MAGLANRNGETSMSNELDEVPCYYIGRRLRWLGWVVTDMKEKYGTWRVYCHMGPMDLHDVTHNGYHYIQYRGILRKLHYATHPLQVRVCDLLGYVLRPIQKKWYRRVYRKALEKFPEEAYNILIGADWHELLSNLDSHYRSEVDDDGTTVITWADGDGTNDNKY